MSRMQNCAVDWDGLTDLWSAPEADAFLGQAASDSLPKRGRLQQLLVKTQQILVRAVEDKIQYREAAAAVEAKAVVLLARLMHVLQQNPRLEVAAVVADKPFKSVWYCVTYTLTRIFRSIDLKGEEALVSRSQFSCQAAASDETAHPIKLSPIEASCRQQLEEAAGMSVGFAELHRPAAPPASGLAQSPITNHQSQQS
jgi:hypothetical protein